MREAIEEVRRILNQWESYDLTEDQALVKIIHEVTNMSGQGVSHGVDKG